MRDLEEAYRHIKKDGSIILLVKRIDRFAWCELYAVSDGCIIPVITSNDGLNFEHNRSLKTKKEMENSK